MSRYRDRMGNDRKTKREIGRRLRRGSVMMCMMITSAMLLSAVEEIAARVLRQHRLQRQQQKAAPRTARMR